ncbi:MAG TPA: hypothetical protein VF656_14845 [Pyrinomonadaceae bacterium]
MFERNKANNFAHRRKGVKEGAFDASHGEQARRRRTSLRLCACA